MNKNNMREIKFRAFGHENKEMIEVGDLTFFKDGSFCINDELPSSFQGKDLWELMQFTGLKDSKGRDIFEGDILKATNKYNSTPTKRPSYEVIFEEGAFCGISLKRHRVTGKGLRTLKLKFDDFQEMVTAEIISNIHESPELINEEK